MSSLYYERKKQKSHSSVYRLCEQPNKYPNHKNGTKGEWNQIAIRKTYAKSRNIHQEYLWQRVGQMPHRALPVLPNSGIRLASPYYLLPNRPARPIVDLKTQEAESHHRLA